MTVTRPQNASAAMHSAWRERDRPRPSGSCRRWAMIRHRIISDRPSSRPGMTPAMNRCADRDRAAGRERVDHRVVRGRDQQRLQRARDRHVDGEEPRVALLDHLRDHHRADRGGVGDRRARDAAEHRRGEDVDQREAAADEADEDLGEVDDALRHAAFGHDAAGEDEERDREQREAVACRRRSCSITASSGRSIQSAARIAARPSA